ncbi:helix-turn-helix transcriptional regulator, partial [Singulisphaera rosea]
RLRVARLAAGFRSQSAAAKALGIAQASYWRFETDANPRWETFVRILRLGLPLEHFFPHEAILEAADRVRVAETDSESENNSEMES